MYTIGVMVVSLPSLSHWSLAQLSGGDLCFKNWVKNGWVREERKGGDTKPAISNIPLPMTPTFEDTVKSIKTHQKLGISGVHMGTKEKD